MSPRLRVSAAAELDLREIASFISRDDRAVARRWLQKLRARARARSAARAPNAGRKVPEYDREDLREVLLGAYRIGYRVNATDVVLLFVIEGHQRLRNLGPLSE